MAVPTPSKGRRSAGSIKDGKNLMGRRSVLELARIYVSASAYGAALGVLDRLALNSWDEEARLLRAESLLGVGRTAEAEEMVGPTLIPGSDSAASSERPGTEAHRQEAPAEGSAVGPVLPLWEDRKGRRRGPSRRERLAHWRFLLQLRILHRTGRYRHVIEFGRAFFSGRAPQPSILVARIATVVAQSTLALRQPAVARGIYEEILELYNRLRYPEGAADTLLGLANSQMLDCHWDEADALYQEARFRYEDLGQSDKALACHVNLGVLRGKRGDLPGGRTLLLQALTRSGQLGDARRVVTIELGLGLIEMRLGAFRAARSYLLSALRRARRIRSPRSRSLAFEFLGEMFLYTGALKRARACLQASRKIALTLAPEGDLLFEALRREAEVALVQGDAASARRLSAEAQEMARAFGDPCEVAAAARIQAEVEALSGRPARALEMIVTARDTLDRLGETFERARLELLRIRLEIRQGTMSPGRAREQIHDTCRAFLDLPESPIRREADRILAELDDVSADFTPAAVAEPPISIPIDEAPGRPEIKPVYNRIRTGESDSGTPGRRALDPEVVSRMLSTNGWNVAAAARDLGVTRASLDRFLRRLDLRRPAANA